MRTFLLGGARSGKSAVATRWAHERSADVCCLVTAVPSDSEMADRIDAHRRERPAHWRVREAPLGLASALGAEVGKPGLILVDCLTVWTANCLWPQFVTGESEQQTAGGQRGAGGSVEGARADNTENEQVLVREVPPDIAGWRRERNDFLEVLRAFTGEIILVSNEVGIGIVPERPAARVFRDEQGWLNQAVAAVCDEAYLVTAGLPLRLK